MPKIDQNYCSIVTPNNETTLHQYAVLALLQAEKVSPIHKALRLRLTSNLGPLEQLDLNRYPLAQLDHRSGSPGMMMLPYDNTGCNVLPQSLTIVPWGVLSSNSFVSDGLAAMTNLVTHDEYLAPFGVPNKSQQ